MRPQPFSVFLLVIAIASGLVVLLGYWINLPALATLRDLFVRWAATLAGIAVLVGILNLLYVHWLKVSQPKPGGAYSLALLIAFVLTFLVAIVDTPTGSWSLWIFRYIQLPVEASLLALLAITLLVAVFRMLHRRFDWFSLVYIGTAILILVGSTYLPEVNMPVLQSLRTWLLQVPAVAGARGILLGIGIGVVATGVRILTGSDRPYEG